jgi:hypothetical protein
LPYKTRCKTGRSGAKVRAMKSCRKFLQQTHPISLLDPYLMFQCVSYYLGAFGTVRRVTTLSSKQAKLVQKFMPRSRVGIFRNERTRSTPLDSKLMFRCVLYYLGAFSTIWLPYKTRCKTGWSGAKLRVMKSCRNFSQQTTRSTPLDRTLMFRCISYYFCAFGTVRLRYKTHCKTGQTDVKVRATKSRQNFSQRTQPIHPIGL